MDCRNAEYLMHGYFDDELDLQGSCEFVRHLEDCSKCADKLASEQSLRLRFARGGLSLPAPSHLRESIKQVVVGSQSQRAVDAKFANRWGTWVASAALAVAVLASLIAIQRSTSAETLLAQQIRDGHVRSLMAGHLKDVDSSDQHTVKPWFAGHLDFSPWVGNLSDEGFPLHGGRLEYLDNRRIAALVFMRRNHVINLFIWPSPGAGAVAARMERQNNYQMLHWSTVGMRYWAVSDLNAGELSEFVSLVQSQVNRVAAEALANPAP